MQARLLAFVIWAAVAASAVFWLLRLWTSSPTAPPYTVSVPDKPPPRGDLTRVFGAPPAAAGPAAAPTEPALASRFKLLGVAAPREGGDVSGLALIAVDGKPARGFKVGAAIDGELVLQSVHPRGAALGPRDQGPSVSLELPALPGATASPRAPMPGVPPLPAGMPPMPGAGTIAPMPMPMPMPMPTALVPPPPPAGAIPNFRPGENAESGEPQPVQTGTITR
jgi:general secretion pathway protein C